MQVCSLVSRLFAKIFENLLLAKIFFENVNPYSSLVYNIIMNTPWNF